MKYRPYKSIALLALYIVTLVPPMLQKAHASGAPQVWLGGVPPFAREKMFQETDSDYLKLFTPDAPWGHAAQHVQVFLTNGGLILRESDDVLKTVFADLQRRHIALAVETAMLSGNNGDHQVCGQGVEGYAAPDQAKAIATRIKKNGGTLDYIVMDEPLWFGHWFHGPNACQASIASIAEEIAQRVTVARQVFPSVQVGDDEPVAPPQPADWNQEIGQWLTAYKSMAGVPLSFMNADVQWAGPWEQQLPIFKNVVKSNGSKFGIVYNGGGTGGDENDQKWIYEAQQRFRTVESDTSLVPDLAILQTWARFPHHMLPENDPSTMTNLVLRYTAPR